MITVDHRPSTFRETAGQSLVKKSLMAIVKNPEGTPHSIILSGPYGSGKTTLARVFALALNCEDKSSVEPCGKCAVCTSDLNSSYFYQEYDSAIVGNVDTIRELRDTFYYSSTNSWKVIVIDEAHLMSKVSQSALLKVIEEVPPKVKFIFATTHPDNLLPTIRSRSLELNYSLVKQEDIINNLKSICAKESVSISEDILKLIAVKSQGHMRNAHMLLDNYVMLGEKDFRETIIDARPALTDYVLSLVKRDKTLLCDSIDRILQVPISEVKTTFDQLILDMTLQLVGLEENSTKVIVDIFKSNTLKLIKLLSSDWVKASFTSDVELKVCLLCLFQTLQAQPSTAPTQSIYQQAVRK